MLSISETFYTLQEASERLMVNRLTLYRWIKSGKFEVQRVGGVVFIEKTEVERIKAERQSV